MKNFYLRFIGIIVLVFFYSISVAQPSNGTCAEANPICIGQGFPAAVDAGNAESGPSYACLSGTPTNPSWHYFEVETEGHIEVEISNSNDEDIDYTLYGPFSDPVTPCAASLTSPIDCGAALGPTEEFQFEGLAGEFYILFITNYSNNPTNIFLEELPASTGAIKCGLICGETTSTIDVHACGSYTSPSGEHVWTESDTYKDTLVGLNSIGCDSIITINLTVGTTTTSTIDVDVCDTYTSPSGRYVWTTSDTYKDTLYNGNSAQCDSIITINLTINTVNVDVSIESPTITASASGATYQWLVCDTMEEIDGETDQEFTATENGSYAVEVTQNECVDTSECVNITGLGIFENTFGSNFKVYPNPTSGDVTISTGEQFNAEIRVISIYGQLISAEEIKVDNDFNISIEAPAGYYIIELRSTERIARIKILKE